MKKKRKELETLKKSKQQENSNTNNNEPAVPTSNFSNADQNKNSNFTIKSSLFSNPKQTSNLKSSISSVNNPVKEADKKSDLSTPQDTEDNASLKPPELKRRKSKKRSVPNEAMPQGASFAPIFGKLEEKRNIKESKSMHKSIDLNKIPNLKDKKAVKVKDSNKILEKYLQLFTSKIVGHNVVVEINTMHQSMKEEIEKLQKKIKDTEDEVQENEKKEEINKLKENISKLEKFLRDNVNNDFLKTVKENTELEKENRELEKKLFNLKETLKNEEEEYAELDKNFDEVIAGMQEEIKFAEKFEDQLIDKIKNQGGDLIHVVNDICQRENNYDYSYKEDEIE